MTDDDRPTTPGTIAAADAAIESVHERDTLPAPAPPEPLEDTPPLGLLLHSLVLETQRAIDAKQASESNAQALELEVELEVEIVPQEQIDTWRPPPPLLSDVAVVAPIAALPANGSAQPSSADVSSIAPRELARRAQPLPRVHAGRLAAAAFLVLGATAFLWARSQQQPDAEMRAAAAARAIDTRDRGELLAPPSLAIATAPMSARAETARDALVATRTAEPAAVPVASPRRLGERRMRMQPARLSGDLPQAPTRDDIGSTLQAMRGEIAACTAGRPGLAELDLTIQSSGHVSHALVSGDFAGTPQGSCIARTLRKARFAAFQKAEFRVLYRMLL